jgi:hypothetical protein
MNGKKDIEHELVFNNYLKTKNYRHALKYLFIWIRMLEHQKRFTEIPKIIIRGTYEIIMPYIIPLIFEKTSIYFLLVKEQFFKKFCFYQIMAGSFYKSQQNVDLRRYTMQCFGNVLAYFNKNTSSLFRIKELVNTTMGEICLNIKYDIGALRFYNNCLELSIFRNEEQNQAILMRHFLNSIDSVMKLNPNNLFHFNKELNIIEVINYSLIVIEEQDFEITKASKWNSFLKYTKVRKNYINLSENDANVIKNLDNIINNKQNFSNFYAKRNFKTNIGNKIYVRFLIRNPMNLNLSVSSIKLNCDFESKAVDYEELNFILEKNSTVLKTVCCIPKEAGRISIKGLEIELYKIAHFTHSFYKKTVNPLYSNRLNGHPKPISEIFFDVIDERQDIKVTFDKKEYNLYLNEFFLLPMTISNHANLKIKRFCMFLDDNDTNNEHVNIQSLSLSSSIFKEVDIPRDSQYSITIPICPQLVGSFYLKIIVKFEEEQKFKEIEIKRFILRFNVAPSIKFTINQDTLTQYRDRCVFSLEANTFLKNKELTGLCIHKVRL